MILIASPPLLVDVLIFVPYAPIIVIVPHFLVHLPIFIGDCPHTSHHFFLAKSSYVTIFVGYVTFFSGDQRIYVRGKLQETMVSTLQYPGFICLHVRFPILQLWEIWKNNENLHSPNQVTIFASHKSPCSTIFDC